MVRHFEDNGFLVESKPTGHNRGIEVEVVSCGFRVTDWESESVSAYFEAKYRFLASSNPQPAKGSKSQRLLVIGRRSSQWEEYEQSEAAAMDEFQQVLSKAGRTLANKFIYSREH